MRKPTARKFNNADLLKRLETARIAANISQNELCKRAHVSASFFTGLRNGCEPGLYKIKRLAEVMGLTLSDVACRSSAKR